jgi:hypothetical protein
VANPPIERGLKGQRVKMGPSANIDAGNMKFGQNVISALEERIFHKNSLIPISAPKTSKMMFLEAYFTIFL